MSVINKKSEKYSLNLVNSGKFILKNMAKISLFLAISVGAMANLDEGRGLPKNREVLNKIIEENKNQRNYLVFDWDYTSIYQNTQENLFRYQIDNLRFKMRPEQFSKAIRKDIPLNNFSDEYRNIKGEVINIQEIAADLDKDYTFIYKNYIKEKRISFEKIKETEEFKDFRGKLDDVAKDDRALIQKRNSITGLLDPKN